MVPSGPLRWSLAGAAEGAAVTTVDPVRRPRRRRGGERARVARLVGPGCVVASSVSLQSAAALATTVFAAFGSAEPRGCADPLGALRVYGEQVLPQLRD
jgi:hypothetical protein